MIFYLLSIACTTVLAQDEVLMGWGGTCADGGLCSQYTGETCKKLKCSGEGSTCDTNNRCTCEEGYCAVFDADAGRYLCKKTLAETGSCCSTVLTNKWGLGLDGTCSTLKCKNFRHSVCIENQCACLPQYTVNGTVNTCSVLNSKLNSWVCQTKGSAVATGASLTLLIVSFSTLLAL